MTQQPHPVLIFSFAMFALTAILVIIGFVLHRRGRLTDRRAALGWVLLCIVPLLVSFFHSYAQRTDPVEPPVESAPAP